jgi:DNA helicase HerA-like ATPase
MSIEEAIQKALEKYERPQLAGKIPAGLSLAHELDGLSFVRLGGLAYPERPADNDDFFQRVADFATGAHACQNWLSFVVVGSAEGVNLWFALQDEITIQSLLSGYFPGVLFPENPVVDLGTRLIRQCSWMGVVSGIPSTEKSAPTQNETPHPAPRASLDRIVRSMRGVRWFLAVRAFPQEAAEVLFEREVLLGEIGSLAPAVKAQVQESNQYSAPVTNRESASESTTTSAELLNRKAQYTIELMESQLKRLDSMLSSGRWKTDVFFGAAAPEVCRRLGAMIQGAFAGPNSRPEPLRVHFQGAPSSGGHPTSITDFQTDLTSAELAAYLSPLQEEVPGFAVHDLAVFDVDYGFKKAAGLRIGQVQWNNQPTPAVLQMAVADLVRHGVVFGVTGSGKTTSLLNILNQVWSRNPPIPFMVIEPAKTEYRALLGRVVNGIGQGPIPELRVYTLGNEYIAPFRMNPFEFETSDIPENIPLLTHIDFLKAVFNAAFILYAPMPYVLEMALHEVYEDRGWNLATGKNVRLPDEEWKNRSKYPIFPTLTDLYLKVVDVTRRLGYESRVEQDVIAGLRARIGALRLGSKGMMLDTPRGIPMADLLAGPTVIELENIGNDDEKTFLMGLLLARMYEYRRIQNTGRSAVETLEHVLVIEEAHRLLKNVSTQVDTESSNLRAQAIETFVNMLSEVRHYGQGVLVAEQIPSKLTPDVIKNTNLKLIHRLLSQDDRELVGFSMNMNDSQVRRFAILKRGEAVVYTEDEDHPILVRMENFKSTRSLISPADMALRSASLGYISLKDYLFTPDYADFGLKITDFSRPDPMIYEYAHQLIGEGASQRLWGMVIARTIYSRTTLIGLIEQIERNILTDPRQLAPAQYIEALRMVLVLGTYQVLEMRAASRGWQAPSVAAMRLQLTRGLINLARSREVKDSATELDRFVRLYEKALARSQGPYPGCRSCRNPCTYLAEVQQILSASERTDIALVLDGTYEVEDTMYSDLRRTLRGVVQNWLDNENSEVNDIGYCTGLATAHRLGLADYGQDKLSRYLAAQMLH